VEDEEEGGTVLAAAQGDRNAVARQHLLLQGNGAGNPLFEIGNKMGAAQVLTVVPPV
jgi:hypothetical protein